MKGREPPWTISYFLSADITNLEQSDANQPPPLLLAERGLVSTLEDLSPAGKEQIEISGSMDLMDTDSYDDIEMK